jgi:hypothetical protein
MNHESERGASRVKTFVALLIVVAFLYVAAKVVPIYFANFQLQDKMRDEALYAQANRRTPNQLQEIILTEAKGLDLPVRAENISVEMTGNATRISADYTVTVDFTVYQLKLRLTPTSRRD